MRRTSAWIVISVLPWSVTPVNGAQAQDDTASETAVQSDRGVALTPGGTEVIIEEPDVPGRNALEANAQLLDSILSTASEKTIREKKFAAAAGVTGGAILIGLGTWRLVEEEPHNQFTRGLGVMFMTLGAVDLTTGVYAATRISHERRRQERWEKARADGITEIELAHFEGELQAASETREGERLLVRWNGLTHALAGVLVIALSPVPTLSGVDRTSAYIIGSVFVATGSAAFGLSFRDTPSEAGWKEYNERKVSTTGPELTFRVAPAISRNGLGLSVSGSF